MGLRLAALFAVGVCLGSLLNLAIYRLAYEPRAISPWSRQLPAAPPRRITDRLPLVGWLGLRRESALHGQGFWVRPLALELLFGVGIAALYWWEIDRLGLLPESFREFLTWPMNQRLLPSVQATLHAEYLAHVILISFLVVASFIDLDEKTIPDAVTIPGTLIGLLLATALPQSLLPIVNATTIGGQGLVNQRLDFLRFADGSWPWLSVGALALGIGCFWLWCVGLMTRIWRMRRGWRIAVRLFTARLVRDPLTKWLLILGLFGTAAIAIAWHFDGVRWEGLLTALVGMAIGGGLVWVVRIVGGFIIGREAMGFGDVTLMAMIGTFVGWQPCLVIFFLAPFGAAAIGGAQWLLNRDPEIRFGPFLSLATIITIVRWTQIWKLMEPYFAAGWLIPLTLVFCLILIAPLLIIVRAVGNLFRGHNN